MVHQAAVKLKKFYQGNTSLHIKVQDQVFIIRDKKWKTNNKHIFPALFRLARDKQSLVFHNFFLSVDSIHWDILFRRYLKQEEELVFSELINLLQFMVITTQEEDQFIWASNSKFFSVKNPYQLLEGQGQSIVAYVCIYVGGLSLNLI